MILKWIKMLEYFNSITLYVFCVYCIHIQIHRYRLCIYLFILCNVHNSFSLEYFQIFPIQHFFHLLVRIVSFAFFPSISLMNSICVLIFHLLLLLYGLRKIGIEMEGLTRKEKLLNIEPSSMKLQSFQQTKYRFFRNRIHLNSGKLL